MAYRGEHRRLDALISGSYMDPVRIPEANRLLVVALDHSSRQVSDLADRLAGLQASHGDFKPIVVTRSSSTRRLRSHGFFYERIMPLSQWERIAPADEYPPYLARRLRSIADMYQPHARIELPGGATLTASALDGARHEARAPQHAPDGVPE